MKTTQTCPLLTAAFLLFVAVNLPAQVFNSGSVGTLGDIVITSNTVWNIPNNGEFHVNTLVVNPGVTLSFLKPTNGLNPPVYILARSNVTIQGTISVDGRPGAPSLTSTEGGPGGFDGGGAGIPPATQPGAGHGPGRGLPPGGGGSYGSASGVGTAGPTYGNLLLFPLVGGSGGAGGTGNPGASGGGGGGALLIASDTRVALTGTLSAKGGNSYFFTGPGSGGAVRLVAPVITGSGTINVTGGLYVNGCCDGGNGRARIDCLPQPISISVYGRLGTPPWHIGRNPVIFPPAGQRLEIIHAAGTDIPAGTNSAVFVTLPVGSSSNQVVTLKAINFTGSFDVRVDATPENGPSSRTNFVWNVGANPALTTNVTMNIPANNPTRIIAWAELLF